MIAHGLLNYTLFVVASIATVYVLLVAKSILVPVVIAFYVWYLINALAEGMSRVSIGNRHPSRTMSFVLALVLVLVVLWGLIELVIENVTPMVAAAPEIEATLQRLINQGMAMVGLKEPHGLQELLNTIDLKTFFSGLVGAVSDIAGMGVTILLYLAFLFVEQANFKWKLTALIGDPEREERLQQTLERIGEKIRTYVWLKTVACLMIAACSLAVMLMVGLEYAMFWAILIFVLNFIPYLGPAIGIILATLAAIVQFQTFSGFLIVLAGLGIVSFFIGSIVEPKLFGKSLNMSPLIVLLALAAWGTLWGVVGMILCIPIMVSVLIVLDSFPNTRPLALAMAESSEDE